MNRQRRLSLDINNLVPASTSHRHHRKLTRHRMTCLSHRASNETDQAFHSWKPSRHLYLARHLRQTLVLLFPLPSLPQFIVPHPFALQDNPNPPLSARLSSTSPPLRRTQPLLSIFLTTLSFHSLYPKTPTLHPLSIPVIETPIRRRFIRHSPQHKDSDSVIFIVLISLHLHPQFAELAASSSLKKRRTSLNALTSTENRPPKRLLYEQNQTTSSREVTV